MFNPPNPNHGAYLDLWPRLTQRLQAVKAQEQMLDIARAAYNQELRQENIILSRVEKERLFRQVMQTVLTDMLAGLGEGK